MNCPQCEKEIVADRLFCTWCESFLPRSDSGTKAGLFRRWLASAIDPGLILVATFLPAAVVGAIAGESAGLGLAVVTILVVLLWFFKLFVQGMTPGKWILGEQVVDMLTGRSPGLGKMFVREVVGKFVSGLFLGAGFFWAIWDKDRQAWHDKIAGTVVVRRRRQRAGSVPPAPSAR